MREGANCQKPGVDPEWFYWRDVEVSDLPPVAKETYRLECLERDLRAQLTCINCPLVTPCLKEGLDQADGVWGGTTAYERRLLRSRGLIRQMSHHSAETDRQIEAVSLFYDEALSLESVATLMGSTVRGVMEFIKGYVMRHGLSGTQMSVVASTMLPVRAQQEGAA